MNTKPSHHPSNLNPKINLNPKKVKVSSASSSYILHPYSLLSELF